MKKLYKVISVMVLFLIVFLLFMYVLPKDKHGITYSEEKDEYGFIIRTYFDGEGEIIGESFGYAIDDCFLDIDGDGETELVANVTYEIDGHREVIVYKKIGKAYYSGIVNVSDEVFPDLYDWGVNAVISWYDKEESCFYAEYCTNDDSIKRVTLKLSDFSFDNE